MPSAITFGELNFSGTPSNDDVLAARYIIGIENKKLARLIPPGTPFPANTPAAIKASYLAILIAGITEMHDRNIFQARSDTGWQVAFTTDQLEQIRSNLFARLNAGESAASIIADTATL